MKVQGGDDQMVWIEAMMERYAVEIDELVRLALAHMEHCDGCDLCGESDDPTRGHIIERIRRSIETKE